MRFASISIFRVSPDGSRIDLAAANVPYSSLLWTRRFSKVGEFQAVLNCPIPVEWPGRYLITSSESEEVGIAEKASCDSGSFPTVEGRFAESLWDRAVFTEAGGAARGDNWRQAVTAAAQAWLMPDAPRIALGAGTQAAGGSSYAISGQGGDSPMELIYSAASGNGSHPVLSYPWGEAKDRLTLSIADGRDLSRSQRANPWVLFSVMSGGAAAVSYSGDYSTMCSEVRAYAEKGSDADLVTAAATVAVPGFDSSAMWRARAFEDVGSLVPEGENPTQASVSAYGGLRAYDHMAALEMDCDPTGGYREKWDLGDTVEVEFPEMGISGALRIEEVRETYDKQGARFEVTVGNRSISKLERKLMGRR